VVRLESGGTVWARNGSDEPLAGEEGGGAAAAAG
jgi:hypothetical protein